MASRIRRFSSSIKPGADGVEFADDGRTPIAFRIFRPGKNDSDQGPVYFTERGAASVMAAFKARGMPLKFDYDHESTVPVKDRRASGRDGFGVSSGKGAPAMRGDECWAVDVSWTSEAKRQILTGERDQVSPYFHTGDGAEIDELYGVALCYEGATHNGAQLAACWARFRGEGMDIKELIAACKAAIGAGDNEQALSILDQIENAWAEVGNVEVDVGAQEMARETNEEVKAMSRALGDMRREVNSALMRGAKGPGVGGATHALSREVLASRAERVEGIAFQAERDGFTITPDAVRVFSEKGDVDGFKILVGEVRKHARTPEQRSGGKPPKGTQTPSMTDAEKRAARRLGVTDEQFIAQRDAGKAV